jgi:probable LLM family oxidoreductase
MEIGIDSFAASPPGDNQGSPKHNAQALSELLERIEHADKHGLDTFGIGEHHREEFLDSAPSIILAAAAARTKNIRLNSAVTVLSAADPVRVFQQFATIDLISGGRVEIVAGRGSFIEAFPLFGLDTNDYNDLYAEKLELLLKIRDEKHVTWSGRFRPALHNQEIFPRPLQEKLPIWLGAGGTPASFVRAGSLGLPLMVAIIGGETRRFKALIDLYYQAGKEAGFQKKDLKVGLHSFGYVAKDRETAIKEYFPGYAKAMTKIGRERGWPPVTMEQFQHQINQEGAMIFGSPDEVVEKLRHHSEALGGISRFTFQLDNAGLTHQQLMKTIELIGKEVAPKLRAVS